MNKIGTTFTNPVKEKISQGKKVSAAWLQMSSVVSAEIMSRADFDFLICDMEHGSGDFYLFMQQCQAIEGFGTVPFARIAWNDPVIAKRTLDAGAYGLLIPYVNTKEEAMLAVSSTKYPPEGIRGLAASPRAAGYTVDSLNYLKNANKEIFVMIAIESKEACMNIDEILSVEGLDGIFIGPMDLATSMGHFANPAALEVQEMIKSIESKVFASDKVLVSIAPNFEASKILYDRGYSAVVMMSDSSSLATLATKESKSFRETYN